MNVKQLINLLQRIPIESTVPIQLETPSGFYKLVGVDDDTYEPIVLVGELR